MRQWAAWIVVVGLLLGACTGGSPERGHLVTITPAATKTPVPTLAVAWSTGGFRPVTGVTLIGPTALLYGTVGQQLYLYGLDAASGRVLWRRPASTGDQEPGIRVRVESALGSVVYIRPIAGTDVRLGRVVIADPRTGRDRAVSVAQHWMRLPGVCDDDVRSLCTHLWLEQTDGSRVDVRVRIDPRYATWNVIAGDAGYRELGGGVVSSGGTPERLGLKRGNEVTWIGDSATIFGPGVTSDWGWNFDSYAEASVVVGTMSSPVTTLGPDNFRIDLSSRSITVALDAHTGVVLWRAIGAEVDCSSRLTIPTGDERNRPLLCRYTGTIEYQGSGAGQRQTVKELHVAVEQFDLRTGTPVWSRDVGASRTLAGIDDDGPPYLSDTSVGVLSAAGASVLDTVHGTLRPAVADDAFWCSLNTDFAQSARPDAGRPGPSTRYGSGTTRPCSVDGKPRPGPVTMIPNAVSQRFGRLQVVATPTAVMAYQP